MSVNTTQTHEPSRIDSDTLELANTVVELEAGPAGTIAAVRRAGDVDYAGPLDDATVEALREVSR